MVGADQVDGHQGGVTMKRNIPRHFVSLAESLQLAVRSPSPRARSAWWGGSAPKAPGWGALQKLVARFFLTTRRAPHPRPLPAASLRSAGGGESRCTYFKFVA